MSGMGYKGGPGQIIDTEAVKEPIPPLLGSHSPTPKDRTKKKKAATGHKAVERTLKNRRLRIMETALLKEQAGKILEGETTKAELAADMVVGILSPSEHRKGNVILDHPQYKKIETELILTRGADFESICVRYDIKTKSGDLAVKQLASHYGRMRERYSRLFDTLDRTAREKLANSYLNKVDEIYGLARSAHGAAMEQLAFAKGADGEAIPYFAPDYEAAANMIEKMLAATNLIGSAMERQKEEEPQQNQGSGATFINGPVGKIQILGLPKALPPKAINSPTGS